MKRIFWPTLLSLIIHLIILGFDFKFEVYDRNSSKSLSNERLKIKLITVIKKQKLENNIIKKNKEYVFSDKTYTSKNKLTMKDLSLNDFSKELIKSNNSILSSKKNIKDKNTEYAEFNTIKLRYYSFFKRIYDSVGNNWKLELDKRNFSRSYSNKLGITLDEKGNILEISVIEKSGNDFYDKTTINAFLRASPFNNPPKKLSKKGKIKFEWSFLYN
jgi:hypothetical protein